MCRWIGSRLVWAISNFIVFACMATTAIISVISVREYSGGIEHGIGANQAIKVASLVVFTLLGFPLAVCICFLGVYHFTFNFCQQNFIFPCMIISFVDYL